MKSLVKSCILTISTLVGMESRMLPDNVDVEQCPMFALGRSHPNDGDKC